MKINDIGRWRAEIQLAEKFRDDEFGKYTQNKRTRAGESIDYFEKGYSDGFYNIDDDTITTLNLFHAVTKLIVPSLWFQNPQALALPKRRIDEDAAPLAKGIINHFLNEGDVDTENELAVWDGYVLNRGVTKVGYATKFGMDINDPELEKKRNKSPVDKALEAIGLKKGEKEEPVVKPEVNQKIVAEQPYIKWVSPFRFLMDPRSRNIDEAMWVCEEFDKTVAELKRNKNYKNTRQLGESIPDLPTNSGVKIPESQIEEFKVLRVYEVHYHNQNKKYRLVIAKDGEIFKELYHEESIYEMDGFQYDILEFNKHGHLQFKRSDLVKIKNLQDRITSTVDAILEQLDRFVPKIAYDSNKVTPNGVKHLQDGDIGALVEVNQMEGAIQEINLTQYKADLKALIDEFVNLITIMTGITRSKLLGISVGETATGETIAQGGENIRLADMDKAVRKWSKRQIGKYWQVIKQFVPLEDLEIITGEVGVNPQTGKPVYTWLEDIDSEMSQKLAEGQFRFDVEVSSTQKVDSALITKRIENLISILGRTDIIALMQQQGKKVDVAEILRLWLQNNPEIVRDVSRIIQDVGADTPGLLPAEDILLGGRGGQTAGSELNAARAQEAAPAVSPELISQEAAQL